MKKIIAVLTFTVLMLGTLDGAKAQQAGYMDRLLFPGIIEGTGTHFEVTNSDYLNISLESTSPIKLLMESIPETISMNFDTDSAIESTTITLSGFLPYTTYHKYQDSYSSHESFSTDGNGKYSYMQDLSQSHLVFIQPRPSTNFISDDETGGACTSFGSWDGTTKTCTISASPVGTIEISSDNITLDGNGIAMNGGGTGSAIYLSGRSGVVIKNLIIRSFSTGIYLNQSNNISIEGNTASLNSNGIYLNYSSDNNISGNMLADNKAMGINLNNSERNTIKNNDSRNNLYSGILLRTSKDNVINGNTSQYNGPIPLNVSYGQAGILLLDSSNNEISANNTSFNRDDGISIRTSFINNISSNNTAEGNTIDSNIENGITVIVAIDNSFVNNIISGNGRGIFIWLSDRNSVKNSTLLRNINSGIELQDTNDSLIYNNLLKNNFNVRTINEAVNTLWNIEKTAGANIVNGPFVAGNYWSNSSNNGYSDTCVDADHDSICDNSYVINSQNIDHYPLAKPDVLPPATNISFDGSAGTNSWYISEVEITLNANDNSGGSGIAKTEYSFDNSTWNAYSSAFNFSVEGQSTIYYRSADNAGNIETAKSAIIKIDTTLPAIAGSARTLPNSNGWYNYNVTVDFTCEDTTSGPVNPSLSTVISAEGSNLSTVGTCEDYAGNSSYYMLNGINIDKTVPAVQSILSPAPNANGWNNTPVTALFTAQDGVSGIDGESETHIFLNEEGAGQSADYAFKDMAGNYAYPSISDINIDLTPPELTGEIETSPNKNNWFTENVSVHFNCSDNLSGIENCPDAVIISNEGENQNATGTVTDAAGNSSSTTIGGINIDKTAPQTSISVAGEMHANQWYVSDVTISLTTDDGVFGSGISETEYSFNGIDWNDYAAPFIVNEETIVYFRSTDRANNIEATNTSIVRIDQTAPIIGGEATTQPNLNDWYNESVTIHFTASDPISGISNITPDVILSEEGASQSATGTAIDNAGNDATFTVNGINIDKSAPLTKIVLSQSTDDSFATIGSEITLLASDTFSGIENTTYNLDNDTEWLVYSGPFIISEEGNHTVKYRSEDRAGNIEEESTIELVVDNTPPEAVIKFDTDSKDIKVFSGETGEEASYVVLPPLDADSNLKLVDKSDKGSNRAGQSEKNASDNSKKEQNDNENKDKGLDSDKNLLSSDNEDEAEIGSKSADSGNNSQEESKTLISQENKQSSGSKNSENGKDSDKNSSNGSQSKDNAKKLKKEKHDIETPDESDVSENENEDNSEGWELRQYVLEDIANNSLTIILKHKKEGKEAKAKIVSIRYNSASALDIKQNKIYAEYALDQEGSIKNLELKTTVKDQFDAKAKYMSKTNETEITMRLETEKKITGETWEGIVILELLTDKGSLKLNY